LRAFHPIAVGKLKKSLQASTDLSIREVSKATDCAIADKQTEKSTVNAVAKRSVYLNILFAP
jgi:hypothetical protein